MRTRFRDQNYASIYKQLIYKQELFTDPEFIPNQKSLFLPGFVTNEDIKWVRATDTIKHSRLLPDKTITHVHRGAFGAWVSTANLFFQLHPRFFQIIVPDANPITKAATMIYSGESEHPRIFRFRFFKFGRWVEVVVDDYLPISADGQWLCSLSENPRELWVPLMEKAFAKLQGSYQALMTLDPSTSIFVDLTGNIAQHIDLRPLKESQDSTETQQLLHQVADILQLGGLVCCSPRLGYPMDLSQPPDIYAVHMSQRSFVMSHNAFSSIIVQVKSVDPDHFHEECSLTMAQFLQNFNTLIICRLFDQMQMNSFSYYYRSYHFHGKWSKSGDRAGGSATIWKNPQYRLHINGKDAVILIYLQRRHEIEPRFQYPPSIGLYGFKVEENRVARIDDCGFYPEVFRLDHTTHREVFGKFVIPPGNYFVIPTLSEESRQSDYLIRFFTRGRNCKITYVSKERETPLFKPWMSFQFAPIKLTLVSFQDAQENNLLVYCTFTLSEDLGLRRYSLKLHDTPKTFTFQVKHPERAYFTFHIATKSHYLGNCKMHLSKLEIGLASKLAVGDMHLTVAVGQHC